MIITSKMCMSFTNCFRSGRVHFFNYNPYKRLSEERKEELFFSRINSDGEYVNRDSLRVALRRARVAVVDLATVNTFDYFGTITIDDKLYDISEPEIILNALLKAVDNFKYRFSSDFQYIIVPEYGEKNKRLHFHFLFSNIPQKNLKYNEHHYLDFPYFREKFGFIQITKIGDKDADKVNVARYCSKYITKDNIQIRSHRYFASKGLLRPQKQTVYFSSAADALRFYVIRHLGIEPYFSSQFSDDYNMNLEQLNAFMLYFEKVLHIVDLNHMLCYTDEERPFEFELCNLKEGHYSALVS